MDPGGFGGSGAFGGGKAGGDQDPVTFVKRPTVIIRICSLLFAIIVFGSVSSSGWYFLRAQGAEVCVMNLDSSACHYSTFVGIIAFIASIGFIVGEWFFEQMSSIKTRKHYVIFDMAFSGLWAFFYFVAFIYMANSWRKTDDKFNYDKANIIGAIVFAFLSILTWLGSVGLAYQRFKAGSTAAFSQDVGEASGLNEEDKYQAYPGGPEDMAGNYGEQPFQGGAQQGMGYQQQQMQY